MGKHQFTFTGQVKLYPGDSGWYFVALPPDLSEQISKQFHGLKRGWGSLKVKVSIGETIWTTSIFPDFKTKTYLLPIKLSVRKAEHLTDGSKAKVTLQIMI